MSTAALTPRVSPENASQLPANVREARADSELIRVSGIEADVCRHIAERQRIGIAKYGTTVADNPADLRAWLQHAYEETLDQAIYIQRAITEIDRVSELARLEATTAAMINVAADISHWQMSGREAAAMILQDANITAEEIEAVLGGQGARMTRVLSLLCKPNAESSRTTKN